MSEGLFVTRRVSEGLLPEIKNPMPQELTIPSTLASTDSQAGNVAIVVSQYNDHITNKLCKAAVETLLAGGIADNDILIVRVPGAWELVFATQQLLNNLNCRGVVALGAVIKGETTHDQHINRAVSLGLMQLSLEHTKPVAFGLLTVNTLEQAIQRSGGNAGNKGDEAASALLQCLRLSQALA
jgi:6,7-dimethyl-8-ribityllumazine synthase